MTVEEFRAAEVAFEDAEKEEGRTATVLAKAKAAVNVYGPNPPNALLTAAQISDSYDLATALPVQVRVTVAKRYNWPSDGATQIHDAIVAWAAASPGGKPNCPIGGDGNGQLGWTEAVASFLNTVPGFDLTALDFSVDSGSSWTTSPSSLNIPSGTYAEITDGNVTVVAT